MRTGGRLLDGLVVALIVLLGTGLLGSGRLGAGRLEVTRADAASPARVRHEGSLAASGQVGASRLGTANIRSPRSAARPASFSFLSLSLPTAADRLAGFSLVDEAGTPSSGLSFYAGAQRARTRRVPSSVSDEAARRASPRHEGRSRRAPSFRGVISPRARARAAQRRARSASSPVATSVEPPAPPRRARAGALVTGALVTGALVTGAGSSKPLTHFSPGWRRAPSSPLASLDGRVSVPAVDALARPSSRTPAPGGQAP